MLYEVWLLISLVLMCHLLLLHMAVEVPGNSEAKPTSSRCEMVEFEKENMQINVPRDKNVLVSFQAKAELTLMGKFAQGEPSQGPPSKEDDFLAMVDGR